MREEGEVRRSEGGGGRVGVVREEGNGQRSEGGGKALEE